MANGPQVRPSPTAWARVRLLKGDSAGGLWDVSSEIAEARMAIGSDPRCGWVVNGGGVAPFHFEIYWDGNVLWAGNSAGAADVRIDGEQLGDWRPVSGRARIEFGRAAMLVEASDAVARKPSVAPRESGVPLESENTRIAAPVDERREVYASGNSALIKMPPARELEAPLMDAGATRVVSLADADAGRAMPAGPPRVGMGAGVRRVQEPSPISEESTRLGVAPTSQQISGQYPGAAPVAGGQAAASTAPSVALPLAGLRGPVAGGESPFAAPPPRAPDASTAAFARVGEKLKGELGKKKLSQPPRTWLLLALVVAVLVVFVLDAFDQKPEAPEHAQVATATTPLALPDAGVSFAPPRLAQDFAVGPGGIIGNGAPPALPDAGVRDAPRPRRRGDAVAVPLSAERLAADALISGRYREALPLYQALATANPQNPTFAQIVVVLQRRLQATCRNGLTPEGHACIQ